MSGKLGIPNDDKWHEYCKSGKKPHNIPSNPNGTYKGKGWISFGDWLGTGYISNKKRVYLQFTDAREYVRKLGIPTQEGWYQYCKSGKKPHNIPSNPNNVFKGKGWIDFGDWLGTQNRNYLSFTYAREYVRKLGFKNKEQLDRYCKSGKKPDNIPHSPSNVYKGKGWTTWGDFLGSGNVANKNRKFLPFDEAREIVRKLGFQNQEAWEQYSKSGKKPDKYVYGDNRIYKEKGWISLGDWLVLVISQNRDREYLPFEEAREIVRKLGFQNQEEWKQYCRLVENLIIYQVTPTKYTITGAG